MLWLKAIAGDRCAYELLPPYTRAIVSAPVRKLYPKLHHQNVLLRSAYLDKSVLTQLDANHSDIAVVSLGAGFCTRSARLFSDMPNIRTAELDLPDVVEQKRALAMRYVDKYAPASVCIPVDLGGDAVETALEEAIAERDHIVFVLEALMIYLEPEAAVRLLRACGDYAARATSCTLCFADRLPGITGVSEVDVARCLANAGFDLVDYLPKPGLARHMGVAKATATAAGQVA